MRSKILYAVSLLTITSLSLAGCARPTPEVVKPVATAEEEQLVEAAQPVNTPTENPPEIIETNAPVPDTPSGFHAPDPGTWTYLYGAEVNTLDPAWNYYGFSGGIIQNIYDTLVTYAGADPNAVIPKLATGWRVMDAGKTYVFTIRQSVRFHEGQELTAEDVAYSFQRGLLQGGSQSPQWLFTEAFFGTGIYDIAELVDPEVVDDPEALQAADPDKLGKACRRVTDAIAADETSGTVTFHLAQPWAPLLTTLADYWGSIIDWGWAIEQGAWDGDCATWQDYYGVNSGNAPLRAVTNGSGPYMLDHWTPGEEIVLVANEDYWLSEPLWEGGPSGPPRLKRVVLRLVSEWGPRFNMLQNGKADEAPVDRVRRPQFDPLVGEVCTFVDWGVYDCQPSQSPDQLLRLYRGTPDIGRLDLLFVFQVNEEGGNPYLGSGVLDGDGILPDFFSDIHVRKAFNYCFDWDTFIAEVWGGEAVQNYGPFNAGLIGYDPDAPHYSYDPEKCRAEIEQAWDGAVAEVGFRMQVPFVIANVNQQVAAQILQANFAAIDPKYRVETTSLPAMPNYFAEMNAHRLPFFLGWWGEDIHDPHNWVQPFLVGTYAARQGLPQELLDEFQVLINAGVAGQSLEERATIYHQIQKLDYEYAPAIRLVVGSTDRHVQRWVSEYLINPMLVQPFYLWSKE